MPPVRWKLLVAAAAAMCLVGASAAKTGRELPEDGWKPIIGHRDHQSYGEEIITQYRNPSGLASTSEPIMPPQPKPLTISKANNHQYGPAKQTVKSHGKHQQFHFAAGNQGSFGPQILLTHRSQNKPYKMSAVGKNHGLAFNGKRPMMKPGRVQTAAHSNRDEIFAAVPSTALGNYAYYTQTRSPQQQQQQQQQQHHGHVEFGSRFAPSEDFFQFQRLPVQQYILPKYPIPNDVHYTFQAQSDEYTRNLVPPLATSPQKFPEPDNQKPPKAVVFKTQQQEQPVTEQMRVTKVEQTQTQNLLPENILVQVPPPYHQHQTYYSTNPGGEAVDVQVTKEKLKVYHNNIPIPTNYNGDFVDFARYQFGQTPSEAPKPPTYEVTEGKVWQQTPAFHRYRYTGEPVPFLPTPMKPEAPPPPPPTQGEISTVYSELSQINRQKDQSIFTAKEVSTHYPVLGQPEFNSGENSEYSNEITTVKEEQTEMPTQPTTVAAAPRRRPGQRRRRPIKPTTTNDYEQLKNVEIVETTTPPRERPARRRPTRYRTTETPMVEDQPTRTRHRQRIRPTEEMPQNHKPTTDYYQNYRKPARSGGYEEQTTTIEEEVVDEQPTQRPKSRRPPTKYRIKQESEEVVQSSESYSDVEEQKYEEEEQSTEEETRATRTRRPTTTNIHTPENEVDYTTTNPPPRINQQESITIEEIHTQVPEEAEETTTVTTTTTTTTTAEPTTTKSNRLRRPINYKSSPRPRFSVKEYRQRLNQYTSTSTEASRQSTAETTSRLRYPHRSRKPIMRYQQEEDAATEASRSKFVPKSPRYGHAPELKVEADDDDDDDDEEEERTTIKTTNSRLRPFGRNRPTTEATTTTQKASIKPHVFTNLRRPPQISLRNRIFNRYNRTTEKPMTTTTMAAAELEEEETSDTVTETVATVTIAAELESTTAAMATTLFREEAEDVEDATDAVLQSQRVSDLTSSAQNDYNAFKSVAPSVRRVPSYFTIATDDPILPIEAFFPNINRERRQ